MLSDAQLQDADRHRRWAGALVRFCIDTEGNRDVLRKWVAKWEPLADAAIDAYCGALPDAPGAAEKARTATRKFRESLGL